MSEALRDTPGGNGRPVRDGFWLWTILRLTVTVVMVALLVAVGRLVFYTFGFGPLPDHPQPVMAASDPSRAANGPEGTDGVVARGTVVSRKSKGVGSYFSGKVAELEVKKGQRVKRGQLLFRMDTTDLQRRLQAAVANERRYAALTNRHRRERKEELGLLAHDHRLLRSLIVETRKQEKHLAQQQRNSPVRLAAGTRPWSIAELKTQLSASEEYYRKRQRVFHLAVVDSIHRSRAARAEAARLRKLLRQAKRHSPMDGVVTSIVAGEGHWIQAKTPIIRVDDPASYRVVALVKQQTAQPLDKGQHVEVELPDGEIPGKLEKIVPGWDRQLFYTWLWVKPLKPLDLRPGEEVDVVLPASEGGRMKAEG